MEREEITLRVAGARQRSAEELRGHHGEGDTVLAKPQHSKTVCRPGTAPMLGVPVRDVPKLPHHANAARASIPGSS